VQFQEYKLVFRRYAHLYFIMCLDVGDNELAALEAIHLFVEILDHFFTSVTESWTSF
jgi:AP-2 complex subunit sigma-1